MQDVEQSFHRFLLQLIIDLQQLIDPVRLLLTVLEDEFGTGELPIQEGKREGKQPQWSIYLEDFRSLLVKLLEEVVAMAELCSIAKQGEVIWRNANCGQVGMR